jgi:hypothetical protein
LKKPEDLEVLKKLLRADVLVQNLAPGAAARLGLSYKSLREKNTSLIVCDISGYGNEGPYKDKKAYDLLVQSEAGMLSVTGTKSEPAKAGISIADIAAAMYAFSNILAALIQRGKTGQGCRIDVSMLESMVEWMGFPMYYTYRNAPGPAPLGASHASIYPYGPFETGDGRSVMLGIQNEREWAIFCRELLHDRDRRRIHVSQTIAFECKTVTASRKSYVKPSLILPQKTQWSDWTVLALQMRMSTTCKVSGITRSFVLEAAGWKCKRWSVQYQLSFRQVSLLQETKTQSHHEWIRCRQ